MNNKQILINRMKDLSSTIFGNNFYLIKFDHNNLLKLKKDFIHLKKWDDSKEKRFKLLMELVEEFNALEKLRKKIA